MKTNSFVLPFCIALVAAIGNALVAMGQKKATTFSNPFLFGAFSLLIASAGLFAVALFNNNKGIGQYVSGNIQWFVLSGSGLFLLNVFLYMLFRNYGASYYTLYAILAIVTTSVLLSVYVFHEKMNVYYWASLVFAVITIIFFFKGKIISD